MATKRARKAKQPTDEQIAEAKLAYYQGVLREIHSDSPEGFRWFYEIIHDRLMPPHVWSWTQAIYESKKNNRGIVVEAFRGSTKTTAVTITFTAYQIGLHPERAYLLIQVGDDIATDNAAQIADIIANSQQWKDIFPHVEPDRDKGWGAGGYEVKRTDMEYSKWREMNSGRKDPTLVGVGYKSREIIGKHPGMLVVDDIHDENNTSSEKELSTVRKILTDTIFPTMMKDTFTIFIGTPWVENDCLHYALATGEYDHVRTPVYWYNEDGDMVLAWEAEFGGEVIERKKAFSGEIGFARMFLLDLEAAKGVNLKAEWLHEYPSSEIGASWPVFFGIDYASTADKLKDKDRDYFVLAILKAIPGGGLVLVDGVRRHLSKGEGLDLVISYWALYPMLKRIGVENIGKGEEFYNDLLLTRDLKGIVPPLMPVSHGRKSKGERFEKWLAPRFQAARIWIADRDTPFLNEFKREWLTWPNGSHDDCLDGVYMAAVAGEGFMPARAERTFAGQRQEYQNPLYAFGRT